MNDHFLCESMVIINKFMGLFSWNTYTLSILHSKCYTLKYYFVLQTHPRSEFEWTKFLWFAVEIPIWKKNPTKKKKTGHLHHTLWGISLPLSPRRTREQLLSPRAFSRHTSILVQWALVRCTRTLSLWVHSRSICPSWLGWAAKSEWMFASANPVCVIWGPIKATEGQRC